MFCFKILSFCFIIASHHSGHLVQGKSATVRTSSDLQNALNDAVSGDKITLLSSAEYVGDFVLSATESNASITIDGSAARISGSKTALKITSGSWTIHNLTIDAGEVGISIEGSGSVIRNVKISNTKQGVNLVGNDNSLLSVSIVGGAFGVFIEGDRNIVLSCSIYDMIEYGVKVKSGVGTILMSSDFTTMGDTAKGCILGELSSGGQVFSASFSGLSEIKGDGLELRSNTFDGGVNILGCKNVFFACTMDRVYATDSCDGSEQNDLHNPSNTVDEYVSSPIT